MTAHNYHTKGANRNSANELSVFRVQYVATIITRRSSVVQRMKMLRREEATNYSDIFFMEDDCQL
jgi:hypothetical protein